MAMALRLKLDENIPRRVRTIFQTQGNDVETAESENLAGADDQLILGACVAEDRILITLDLDFANIRNYPIGSHKGIWVLRPEPQSVATIVTLIEAGIALSAIEATAGRLWVIDGRRIRIRQ